MKMKRIDEMDERMVKLMDVVKNNPLSDEINDMN